jgi:hypothetical protein
MVNWSTELLRTYGGDKVSRRRESVISSILGEGITYPLTNPYLLEDEEKYRAPDIEFDYTEEEMKSILNWKMDIFSQPFINSSSNILKTREYQKSIIGNLQRDRYSIYRNSRQIGMSKCVERYALHTLMNNYDHTILFMTDKGAACSEFFTDVMVFYGHLPYYLKRGIRDLTARKVGFDNGSRLIVTPTLSGTKGFNFNTLILSDFAFSRDDSNILNSLFPVAVGRSSNIIVYSSVNRSDDQFVKMFHTDNMFKKYTNKYNIVDGRDDAWVKNEINTLGSIDSFVREYECCFPGSQEYNRSIALHTLI